MIEITLPKEEYKHAKKPDGSVVTYCTIRQTVKHVIGLDNCRKRPYMRHGRKFYRPYRNYFTASKCGDAHLELLSVAGYIDKELEHTKSGDWVTYSFNRKGLDWLGEQLGMYIYDPE